MNHAQHLAKYASHLNNKDVNDKTVSNIIFQNGAFFSYGSHYPLLWKIGSYNFVNTSGYSQSTARHICRASVHATYQVDLIGNDYSPLGVYQSLVKTVQELKSKMASKKRKDTAIYSSLKNKCDNARAAIEYVYRFL